MGSQNSARSVKVNKDLSLIILVKEGSPEAVRSLLTTMKWKQLRVSDVILKKTQWTLLHLASWHGHPDLCREFIMLGADANIKDSVMLMQHLETPLHLAVYRGHIPVIKILTKYTVNKSPENSVLYIKKGQTPLDIAKDLENAEIISLIENWMQKSMSGKEYNISVVDIN